LDLVQSYSPRRDYIVTRSNGHVPHVKLWVRESDDQQPRPLRKYGPQVEMASVTNDRLLIVYKDDSLVLESLDLDNDDVIRVKLIGQEGKILFAEFALDGRVLITYSEHCDPVDSGKATGSAQRSWEIRFWRLAASPWDLKAWTTQPVQILGTDITRAWDGFIRAYDLDRPENLPLERKPVSVSPPSPGGSAGQKTSAPRELTITNNPVGVDSPDKKLRAVADRGIGGPAPVEVRLFDRTVADSNPITLRPPQQGTPSPPPVFSRDGRRLVVHVNNSFGTYSEIYLLKIEDLIELARVSAGRQLTANERKFFLLK
jgi:hypothetical protein